MRRLGIAVAIVLATLAGVASASVVTSAIGPGSAEGPVQPEEHAASEMRGQPVADPDGGARWAVRILDAGSDRRCMTVGRTDGTAFGPVDASGRVVDTAATIAGSCADPAAEPLQLAIARYAATAGQGARSVLFAIADPAVRSVQVTAPDGPRLVTPDSARSLVVVSKGLASAGGWTVSAAMRDGTVRIYRPGAVDSAG